MIGKIEADEIKAFHEDEEQKSEQLEFGKEQFQKQLLNGLGDQIINELRNPTPPNKKLGRKMRRQRRMEVVRRNLRNIFLGKKEAETF